MELPMKAVLHSFEYSLDFLRDQVAAVTALDMVAQPQGIANHPAWVVGHLTFICQQLGMAIGLSPWLPEGWAERYAPGSLPVADVARYEKKEEALAMLGDAQIRLIGRIEQLDEVQLNAAFPDAGYRDVFPTIRHALTQVLIGHTAYHIGQVALWRKAMALPALGRSYE